MLLQQKTAIIFGAGGAIGSEVARVFAREGATLFLSGRHHASVERVAAEIRATQGRVAVAQLDVLDEAAIQNYLDEVVQQAETIDIVLNAAGLQPLEYDMGTLATELDYGKFLQSFTAHAGSQFVTARTAARFMIPRQSGVIFFLGSPTGKVPIPGTVGIAASNTAMEGIARTLAAELGLAGIRVIYLKVGPFPETRGPQQAVAALAEKMGLSPQTLGQSVLEASLLKRTPTLQEAAEAITFLASDRASGMTGVIANITAGQYAD